MKCLFISWLLLQTIVRSETSVNSRYRSLTNESLSENRASTDKPNDVKQCSIYWAPSSLKSLGSGLGIYTTRRILRGEAILSGPAGTPDGPCIPVINPTGIVASWNELDNQEWEHEQLIRQQWNDLFGLYWWGRGNPANSDYEAAPRNVLDFQITFGALPNHNCVLDSLGYLFPAGGYDDSLSHRFKDPGAGAYSYHTGRIFQARRDIQAGQEIFLNYGYCSRQELDNQIRAVDSENTLWYPHWTQYVPMDDDYQTAAALTRAIYQSWLQKSQNGLPNDIPDDITLKPEDYDQLATALEQEDEDFWPLTPIVRSLLPNNTADLKQVMRIASKNKDKIHSNEEQDSDFQYQGTLEEILAQRYGTLPRSVEWIREHGWCLENLIPGPSQIEHAGFGAFAQHFIPAGDVVVPVPLLQILDKSVWAFKFKDDEEQLQKRQQLLTNYCFSHINSTLALCPISNAILINHCSPDTRNPSIQQFHCRSGGPNAHLKWAEWDQQSQRWLNATLEQMETVPRDRLLTMEIVATRDIHPGEEVFIDYGPEWEQAWLEHVDSWPSPTVDDEKLNFSVFKANLNINSTLPYLVSNDLLQEEDHPYVFTACLYWPTENDEAEVFLEELDDEDFDALEPEELIETYGDDGSLYTGDYSNPKNHNDYWPCSVLFEEKASDESQDITYLVRIKSHPLLDQSLPWEENELPRFLYSYPRASIRYFFKPFKSDQFSNSAFRHFIPIPNDMFPPQWQNNIPLEPDAKEL